MSEEIILEGQTIEAPQGEPAVENVAASGEPESPQEETPRTGAATPPRSASVSLKDAWKQVESFGEALGVALQGRGNVVMVRINDDALAHLDMLVEAEVTKSRSESAAFLINEGIKANQSLFDKIGAITQQIAELRELLRREVKLEGEL